MDHIAIRTASLETAGNPEQIANRFLDYAKLIKEASLLFTDPKDIIKHLLDPIQKFSPESGISEELATNAAYLIQDYAKFFPQNVRVQIIIDSAIILERKGYKDLALKLVDEEFKDLHLRNHRADYFIECLRFRYFYLKHQDQNHVDSLLILIKNPENQNFVPSETEAKVIFELLIKNRLNDLTIQFAKNNFSDKKELLYVVEQLIKSGRPLLAFNFALDNGLSLEKKILNFFVENGYPALATQFLERNQKNEKAVNYEAYSFLLARNNCSTDLLTLYKENKISRDILCDSLRNLTENATFDENDFLLILSKLDRIERFEISNVFENLLRHQKNDLLIKILRRPEIYQIANENILGLIDEYITYFNSTTLIEILNELDLRDQEYLFKILNKFISKIAFSNNAGADDINRLINYSNKLTNIVLQIEFKLSIYKVCLEHSLPKNNLLIEEIFDLIQSAQITDTSKIKLFAILIDFASSNENIVLIEKIIDFLNIKIDSSSIDENWLHIISVCSLKINSQALQRLVNKIKNSSFYVQPKITDRNSFTRYISDLMILKDFEKIEYILKTNINSEEVYLIIELLISNNLLDLADKFVNDFPKISKYIIDYIELLVKYHQNQFAIPRINRQNLNRHQIIYLTLEASEANNIEIFTLLIKDFYPDDENMSHLAGKLIELQKFDYVAIIFNKTYNRETKAKIIRNLLRNSYVDLAIEFINKDQTICSFDKEILNLLFNEGAHEKTVRLCENLNEIIYKNFFIKRLAQTKVLDQLIQTSKGDHIQKESTEKSEALNKYQQHTLENLYEIFKIYISDEEKILLLKSGIFTQDLVDKWLKSEPNTFDSILKNMLMIVAIEKLRPGNCQLLNKFYSINCFGRYPIEILIDMIDSHGKDVTYGVAIFPELDHNASFTNYAEVLKKLHNDLIKKGYHIRIIETGNKVSMISRLLRFNRKFGDKNKISFVILAAHGSEQLMHFGNQLFLTPRDFINPSAKKLKNKIYHPKAPWLLISCKVGSKGGLAYEIGNLTSTPVTAATNISVISKITPRFNPNGELIKFDAIYHYSDTSIANDVSV